MRGLMTGAAPRIRSMWLWLLDHDNMIFGIVLALIALDNWRTLITRLDEYWVYLINGIYMTPLLSLLTISFSTFYVTVISVILLTAKKPVARYETLMPNLLAVLAGFGVYAFAFLEPAEERLIPVWIPLALLAAGAGLVVLALFWLQRAFSVTPQARRVVRTGPYAWVRHPMYVGNILSILGLGLVIGSPIAIALAIATSALQFCRAHYEDRLLAATFEDYEDYMTKVNAFIPRFAFRKPSLAVLFALLLAVSVLVPGVHAQSKGKADPALGAKCQAWHQKALSGQWFSTREGREFEATESRQEALQATPACKAFFQLQSQCEAALMEKFTADQKSMRRANAALVNAIENVSGCKSIIGFNDVCEAVRDYARTSKGSPRLQGILRECSDRGAATSTAKFTRPAL